MLVTAPLPSAFVADTAHYQTYVEAMREFAAAHGTEYWDFTLCTEAAGLELGTEDFSDAHHLNGQGAEKFTAAFCRVAADSAAGRPTAGYFYDTLDQKLTQAPDGTLAAVQGQAGEDLEEAKHTHSSRASPGLKLTLYTCCLVLWPIPRVDAQGACSRLPWSRQRWVLSKFPEPCGP